LTYMQFYLFARSSKSDCYRVCYRSLSIWSLTQLHSRLESSVEPRSRVALHRIGDMRIEIKRGRYRGVSQSFLSNFLDAHVHFAPTGGHVRCN